MGCQHPHPAPSPPAVCNKERGLQRGLTQVRTRDGGDGGEVEGMEGDGEGIEGEEGDGEGWRGTRGGGWGWMGMQEMERDREG